MARQSLKRPGRVPRTAMQQAVDELWNRGSTLNANGILVGPSGYPANSRVGGSRAKFRLINVATFGTTGSNATFNQRWSVPFSGKMQVRFVIELGNTAAAVTTAAFATAAGRNGAEVNAKNVDGSDATWQTGNFTVAQADADYLTNGKVGRGFSPWFDIDVPLDGAIYSRVVFSANTAGQVGTGTGARLVSDWENFLNSRYPKMRYWANHVAGNFAASNQAAMGNGTPQSEYAPVVAIELRPAGGNQIITLDNISDSTGQELAVGTRGEANFKPYNSSWAAEVVSRRQKAGLPWAYGNHSYEGKTAAFILGRYKELCTTNLDHTGEIALLQPFSVNGGGFNDAIIDSNFALVNDIINLRRAGGKPTAVRTVFPVKGQRGGVLDAWTRGNRLALQLDVPVLDVTTLTLNQPDNTHLDQADQYKVADLADAFFTSIRV